MPKYETTTWVTRGRTRTVYRQVLLRRKRMRHYARDKAKILSLVTKAGLEAEALATLWDTPQEALFGKTPRQMLVPGHTRKLREWLSKYLRGKQA